MKRVSFDDTVAMIRKLGEGTLLAKQQIKSAFQLLPVYPDHSDLLGFVYDDAFYYDNTLPMGCCSIFCSEFDGFRYFSNGTYMSSQAAAMSNSGDCQAILNHFELTAELGDPPIREKKLNVHVTPWGWKPPLWCPL